MTKTKTAPKAKGALRRAQLAAEATAVDAAVEAEQAELSDPQEAIMPTPEVVEVPEAEPVFKMSAVYHIFQQAWERNGGKRTGFTADEIHDLLVTDGGKTK